MAIEYKASTNDHDTRNHNERDEEFSIGRAPIYVEDIHPVEIVKKSKVRNE